MMRIAMDNDPQYADLPFGATVMLALIDEFPCS